METSATPDGRKPHRFSTLTKYLKRYRRYLALGGVAIKALPVDQLRSHLALVLQEVFLFAGDYAGNVRLRNADIPDEEVTKALHRVGFDRTSIIIAHRLSTIEKADKIIVLHHGRLREMGTHDELLKQKGIYHTLYRMQYKKQVSRDSLSTTATG